MEIKARVKKFLRWLERYTKTDMVYVAKGGFWLTFGRIVIFLLSFVTLTAFARWVPKEIFGAYQYILSVTGFLGILILPGINTALIRAIARKKEGMLAQCAKTNFKWAFLAGGACLSVSLWYLFHHNLPLGVSFLIASFLFPLPAIFGLFQAFWQGRKRFDIQSKYLMAINTLEALVFIPVLFLTNNLILIMLAYFVSRTIFRGLFFYFTLKSVKNQETDEETIPFGKHLTLMQSAGYLIGRLDTVFIWQFLGAAPVAIYSLARLPILRIGGIIPLGQLALPKLSEKNKIIKRKLLRKILILFLLFIPITIGMILFIPYLYKLLFPAYLQSIPYAQALSLILIFSPFGLLETSLVAAMKKKELYIIRFTTPFVMLFLFLALIPFYGIWGAVATTLITTVFRALLVFYLFNRTYALTSFVDNADYTDSRPH